MVPSIPALAHPLGTIAIDAPSIPIYRRHNHLLPHLDQRKLVLSPRSKEPTKRYALWVEVASGDETEIHDQYSIKLSGTCVHDVFYRLDEQYNPHKETGDGACIKELSIMAHGNRDELDIRGMKPGERVRPNRNDRTSEQDSQPSFVQEWTSDARKAQAVFVRGLEANWRDWLKDRRTK